MTMHLEKDEFIMGSYISKMMPIFFGFWYFKFQNLNVKINFFITILIILTFYCMVLSNDRAATFLVLGLLIGLTLLYKFKILYKFFTLLAILFSIFISVMIFPSVKDRYINGTFAEILGKNDHVVLEDINILRGKDKTIKNFSFKINDKNIFFFSTAHEAHIKTAINMFIHNPFVGIGPNNFRKLCSEKNFGIYEERGCSTHPHHTLSQILAETGIVGLFFYLIALIYIIVKLIKQFFNPYLNFNILLIYSFYFLILMPLLHSGNIFNNLYIYSISLPFLFLKFIK